jgi:asparagine synthase (glutamine-hydrolysing)
MCGIAGFYNLPGGEPLMRRMLGAIAHRGPDAAGVWQGDGAGASVVLGHRRLSIIDLSAASNQPFLKGDLALTYNGEIYNYQELRHELEGLGARFRTASDTEVLLEAWAHWGPDCLPRLRGMFAFAIFDQKTGRLSLARDHFGIKPLLIAKRDGGVAFASELKGLKPVLGSDLSIDETALVSSLMYYWLPESRSVYRGVEKLPPSHWAEITPDGNLTTRCYWDPAVELDPARHAETSIEELRAVLEDSVRAHLIADVPVNAFLSGGLDSSLVTVMAKQQGQPIEGYTIAFREEDRKLEAMPDDLHYARLIAKQHDIKLNVIEIAPRIAEMLPKMVDILDEPIGDAAAINAYLICQAARERGVKVLLSGMGADEIFGGYRKHYACLLAARYRQVPEIFRSGLVEPIVDRLPVAGRNSGYRTVRWAKRFLSFANLPEEPAFRRSYTHYGREEFADLLNPDLMPAVDDLIAEHAGIYAAAPSGHPVDRMCFTDLRMFLPGLNLTYTDRASMAASTEVRVPYVDKEVVAAAFALPGKLKIAKGETKAPLKQAAEAWLPKDIIYRPKGVFSAPLRAWIRRDLGEMVDDLVADGSLVSSGFLKADKVREMIAEDRAGSADRSKQIWQLLTLETWMRQHASMAKAA